MNLVFYAAARPWATAHRDTLQRFRAALAEGVAYVASHPDRAHEIEQKYLGYTGRSATYSTTVTADDLLFYGNAMRSLGILKKPVGDVNALLLK